MCMYIFLYGILVIHCIYIWYTYISIWYIYGIIIQKLHNTHCNISTIELCYCHPVQAKLQILESWPRRKPVPAAECKQRHGIFNQKVWVVVTSKMIFMLMLCQCLSSYVYVIKMFMISFVHI